LTVFYQGEHLNLDASLVPELKVCDTCTDAIARGETRLVQPRQMQRRQTDPDPLLDTKEFA